MEGAFVSILQLCSLFDLISIYGRAAVVVGAILQLYVQCTYLSLLCDNTSTCGMVVEWV